MLKVKLVIRLHKLQFLQKVQNTNTLYFFHNKDD